MKGRSLYTCQLPGLAASTLLFFAQRALGQSQGEQPGNPTSLSGFKFTPTIIIALAAGGGGGLLLILLIVIVCCVRRRKKKKRKAAMMYEAQTPEISGFANTTAFPQALLPSQLPQQQLSGPTTASFETRLPRVPRTNSDALPLNPTPYGEYTRNNVPTAPTPAYLVAGHGGVTSPPPLLQNVAARRGANPPPNLRVGGGPQQAYGMGAAGYPQGPQGPQAGARGGNYQMPARGMQAQPIAGQNPYSNGQRGFAQRPTPYSRSDALANPAATLAPAPRRILPTSPFKSERSPAAAYGDDNIYAQRAQAAEERRSPRYSPAKANAYADVARSNPYSPPAARSGALNDHGRPVVNVNTNVDSNAINAYRNMYGNAAMDSSVSASTTVVSPITPYDRYAPTRTSPGMASNGNGYGYGYGYGYANNTARAQSASPPHPLSSRGSPVSVMENHTQPAREYRGNNYNPGYNREQYRPANTSVARHGLQRNDSALGAGGYGDYGAGRYGHARDGSAESQRSYEAYGSRQAVRPNRYV